MFYMHLKTDAYLATQNKTLCKMYKKTNVLLAAAIAALSGSLVQF